MIVCKLPAQIAKIIRGNETIIYTPKRLIQEMILTLPFWKEGMNLNLVTHNLEIDTALDSFTMDAPFDLKITGDAWENLKKAMQLEKMNPIGEVEINRLYMKTYRSILIGSPEEEKKNE